MFEWDGLTRSHFLADGHRVAVSRIGILVDDDAPQELLTANYIREPEDLDHVTGWTAIVPLGENGAVLMLTAHERSTRQLVANLELGPDPFVMPMARCVERHGCIVPLDLLTDSPGQLLALFGEWDRIVGSFEQLRDLVREMSAKRVIASL